MQKLGRDIAKGLFKEKKKHALVVALRGNLGAGKTTFAQGFFKAIGIKRHAQSPTFIIMRRHAVKHARFKNVFHIDAYRLKKAEHLRALEFEEIASDPKNIILIEWPERVKKLIPKDATRLTFRHGKKENERSVIIEQ